MNNNELFRFWDYEKNAIDPAVYKPKSKEKYHWKCSAGYEWIERLDHRKQKENVCKVCEKVKVLDPTLISEWNYESPLNNGLNPLSLICSAKQRLGWRCSMGHEWEARLDHRQGIKSGCPYCSGHKIIKDETSLGARFPQLLEEWDYGKNNISPFEVAAKTTDSYYWRCKLNHEWSGSVANRTRRGNGCPDCNKSRTSDAYNLTTQYPDIIEIWDYEQNIKKPQDYLPFSNKEVILKCQFGHRWKDKISAVVSGNRCKVCYPRIEYKEVNEKYNLAYFSPELAAEYNEMKNDLPSDKVSPYSGKKVWWTCSKCSNEWKATVDNRQRGKNCPKCSNWAGTSFSEQTIYYYMRQAYNNVENRYKFEIKNGTIEIDIFFKVLKVAVEYDGYYYHLDKVENDEKKNQLLNESAIKIIRVRESNGNTKKLPDLSGDFYKLDHDGSKLDTLTETIKKLLVLIKDITGREPQKIEVDLLRDGVKIKELYRREKSLNSLAVKNEKVSVQWDYEKNGTLTPEDVYPSDTTDVFWRCDVCDNSWKQKIMIRNRDSRCPFCTGARASNKNSFGTVYPELIKYWHYDRNGAIMPFQVKGGSNNVYSFKCDNCKKEWNEAIRNLVRRKKICEICDR